MIRLAGRLEYAQDKYLIIIQAAVELAPEIPIAIHLTTGTVRTR